MMAILRILSIGENLSGGQESRQPYERQQSSQTPAAIGGIGFASRSYHRKRVPAKQRVRSHFFLLSSPSFFIVTAYENSSCRRSRWSRDVYLDIHRAHGSTAGRSWCPRNFRMNQQCSARCRATSANRQDFIFSPVPELAK